jgi:hypothetical protein
MSAFSVTVSVGSLPPREHGSLVIAVYLASVVINVIAVTVCVAAVIGDALAVNRSASVGCQLGLRSTSYSHFSFKHLPYLRLEARGSSSSVITAMRSPLYSACCCQHVETCKRRVAWRPKCM